MPAPRAVVAGWVEDFNTVRPHSAIGYMTPAAYAATLNPQRASALRHLESSAPMPAARGGSVFLNTSGAFLSGFAACFRLPPGLAPPG